MRRMHVIGHLNTQSNSLIQQKQLHKYSLNQVATQYSIEHENCKINQINNNNSWYKYFM
jgi:hypothetical protein